MRPIVLALAVMLLAPHASAAPQDDAGSGRDAGDSRATALPIPFGPFAGELAGGAADPEDWFYFPVDPAKGLSLLVWADSFARFEFYAQGETKPGLVVEHSGGYYGVGFAPHALAVHLRVWSGTPRYDVEMELVELPDIRVSSVQATPTGPDSYEVTWSLTNHGLNEGWHAAVVRAEHANGDRIVAFRDYDLLPGETRTFAAGWDAFGELGPIDLVVEAQAYWDRDLSDNVAGVRVERAAGPLRPAVGLDAFHHGARVGDAGAGASVYVDDGAYRARTFRVHAEHEPAGAWVVHEHGSMCMQVPLAYTCVPTRPL